RQSGDRRSTGDHRALHAETLLRSRGGGREDQLMSQTGTSGSGTIRIGARAVGAGAPCFVIAEAGINHNGDTALASELVDAAAEAGADAIKFQTHFPEHEMMRGGATAAYVGESLFDLLARTALSRDAHVEMQQRAASRGIMFLSTPFSREAADFLESIG